VKNKYTNTKHEIARGGGAKDQKNYRLNKWRSQDFSIGGFGGDLGAQPLEAKPQPPEATWSGKRSPQRWVIFATFE